MSILDTKDALRTVRVPWIGLQPADTYEELLDSLLALDSAVESILSRVEHRVARERSKLQGLERRIDAASQRARAVAGSSDATVVFSAARFPSSARPPPFERLFYDADELQKHAEVAIEIPEEPPVESFEMMAERRRKIDRDVRANSEGAIALYEADLALHAELATNQPTAPELPDSLAPIPGHVSTASSILLFNTPYNVYADHSPCDNLSGEDAARAGPRAAAEAIAEAPQTVRLGSGLRVGVRVGLRVRGVGEEVGVWLGLGLGSGLG